MDHKVQLVLLGCKGVAGPGGIRGSQWFGGTGSTGTVNLPTDGVFRENDFRLSITGDVEYYDNDWINTGLNLTGPTGPQGSAGDGSIGVIPGLSQENPDYGLPNKFLPKFDKLTEYLGKPFDGDLDDYKAQGSPFINAGLDFVGLGRGNNSLVLGRYATLFYSGAAGDEYTPPGSNKTMDNFPIDESDVPMLIVAQNDYKDPTQGKSYTNGISIGLAKSNEDSLYNTSVSEYGSGKEMDFNDFTNLSISNKFFDFSINSKARIINTKSIRNFL